MFYWLIPTFYWENFDKILFKSMADDIDFKVAAVLPAGGVGQRMGLEIPKQVSFGVSHLALVTH